MGHDRGCSCGREQADYRTCPRRRGITSDCNKENVIAIWDRAKPEIGHNSRQLKTVELTPELLAFALENCESNIRVGMGTLQLVHDGKLDLSQENGKRLVELIENFRNLRIALGMAR